MACYKGGGGRANANGPRSPKVFSRTYGGAGNPRRITLKPTSALHKESVRQIGGMLRAKDAINQGYANPRGDGADQHWDGVRIDRFKAQRKQAVNAYRRGRAENKSGGR